MARVNIVTADNGVGLTNTSAIIRSILVDADHDVDVHTFEDAPTGPAQYDLNLFLERIVPGWCDRAERNVLVPNQEWFDDREQALLGRIDEVWCKTRYATSIFDELGCRSHFLGFTSRDRSTPDVEPDYARFFHLAGHSSQKGTGAVVRLWNSRPRWPELCLVQHPPFARNDVSGANVRYVTAYLDDATLADQQRMHGVHLCPSEAEGFGHSLVEAMSCGALVVTTDAPPMNELVGSDRGVLVPYARTERQGVGTNYHVDVDALGEAIEGVLAMGEQQRRELGRRARRWYEVNDRAFRSRLTTLVAAVTSDAERDRPRGRGTDPDPLPR